MGGDMKRGLFLFPLSLLCLCACSSGPGKLSLELIPIEGAACFHTEEQHDFLTCADPDAYMAEHGNTLGLKSKAAPRGVELSWKAGGKPTSFVLTVSEDENFATSVTYETDKSPFYVQNLYLRRTYFYKVKAIRGEESIETDPASFTVEQTPVRNIYVAGMENLRDCGGYSCEAGGIRQGMLYRSGEMNQSSYSSSCHVDGSGLVYIKDELGIVTDIDLRRTADSVFGMDEVGGMTTTPLGEGVAYLSCPMEYRHQNIFTNEKNHDAILSFFEYLAVPEHYPAVFHCVRGTDRTGALAYALGALCGMNETDLMRDYLFSDFSNLGSSVIRAEEINGEGFYVQGIHDAEGESMSEKAENYLVSTIGVERDTLSAIKNILMEK